MYHSVFDVTLNRFHYCKNIGNNISMSHPVEIKFGLFRMVKVTETNHGTDFENIITW